MKIIDEDVIKHPFLVSRIRKLQELGFTQKQSRDIIGCFVNFYYGIQYPNDIKELISRADVNKDAKDLIHEIFELVIKKGDIAKVMLADKCENLSKFGHEHLYHFQAVSEFRPIIQNNKLQKVVMSIVLEGYAHDANHTKTTSINFQTDLEGLENLIDELNSQLKRIKTEVSALNEKLGMDIVTV